MHKFIITDAVIDHVKSILESIRCPICDKSSGTRIRYACGHSTCDDCVVVAPECSVCLTPPRKAKTELTRTDTPFTKRAENAVNLLNTFQNTFHIDVYKRQRLSEQLKIEKDLFPDCIQAPAKYFNKRKSFMNCSKSKENRLSQLPGQQISPIWKHKMDQPSENVENWLNKYVRKPFADINSNDGRLSKDSGLFKNKKNAMDVENTPIIPTRKRSHFETALSIVKQQSLLDQHLLPVKKKKGLKKPKVKNKSIVKSDTSKYNKTHTDITFTDNDESGIVVDVEPIIIDDSQSMIGDKDINAWLAVKEAEKYKQYSSKTINSTKSGEIVPQLPGNIEKVVEDTYLTKKVPFYLKSSLSKHCMDCNMSCDQFDLHKAGPIEDNSEISESPKNVSITVENKSFIAIIKVRSLQENKVKSMHSVEIQTDVTDTTIDHNKENIPSDFGLENGKRQLEQTPILKPLSQDLFQDDVCIENKKNTVRDKPDLKHLNKSQNVVIEESDSDVDLEPSVSLEVTAEIHRSCEEIDYGILADVDNLEQHSKRPRRSARGYTPNSTDSSEKENFNPNRKKKAPSSKKKPMKK